MHADTLNAPRWHQLSELIAARTGLHFPPERRADLRRALGEAAGDFGCESGEACADRILSSSLSNEELRKLARHLTIGETYFFRERPGFNALATQVLPPLIHHKRNGDQRLRLWSAACSTGEEAYSLAMLVQQVLPDWKDWNVSILATDINAHFLRKAEAGVYGEWSFRDCPRDLRERFFSPVGDRRYRVRAELRAMVTFAELNLAQGAFPNPGNGTHAMDLILCRNLLIYFTPAHARRLIDNLRHSLVDDGWLIVSPSECSQALFTGFAPVNFPGSILYRKRNPHGLARDPVPAHLADAAPPSAHLPAPLTELEVSDMLARGPVAPAAQRTNGPDWPRELAAAESAYAQGEYGDTSTRLRALLPVTAEPAAKLRVLALLTRALANQGVLDEALATSERWIAADRLDAAAHYLHAMVLQEMGERGRARAALIRAVYLQPEFALAHFALGNHARAEARVAEARRHFDNTARLLADFAADDPVPESEGLTAGRLREIIVALAKDA
jgi:chemotaxis protein methyltransferase CheR